MNIVRLILLIFLFPNVVIYAQTDSVMIPTDLAIEDAVYLTHKDFRTNTGITKNQITSTVNKEQLDFLGKSLEKETFNYESNQKNISVNPKSVWGFIQNKTLYVNYKGSFYRVPVFGSICYLVANVEVVAAGFYDPMFGPGIGTSGRRLEVREFLINYYDGNVLEFKMNDAEFLLSRDKVIYLEYKKLSRRKQKEQIFRYLRKYNEAHPVYFLKK